MLLGFYNYLVFYCGMSVVIIKNDDDDDDDDDEQRLTIRFHNSLALIQFYMRGTMTNLIHSELRCLMRAYSSCRLIGRHRFANVLS